MEKYFKFISLLFVIITITSCSDKDLLIVNSQKGALDNMDALREIIHLESVQEQRMAFKLLENEDKFKIWKIKHALIKSNDYKFFGGEKLNSAQQLIVDEIFDSLKERYFTYKTSVESIAYYNNYLPTAIKKAQAYFSRAELKYIFCSLKVEGKKQQLPDIECDCSTESDWCSDETSCSLPCTKTSTFGCGTFLAYSCDGSCGSISISY